MIAWAQQKYLKKYPDTTEKEYQKLLEKLKNEAIRVNGIVEDSIIDERIKRSVAVFVITALAVGLITFLTGGLGALLGIGLLLSFGSAAVVGIASVATIPISTAGRQKGAMRCVMESHRHEILKQRAEPAVLKAPLPIIEKEQAVAPVVSQKRDQQPNYQLDRPELTSRSRFPARAMA